MIEPYEGMDEELPLNDLDRGQIVALYQSWVPVTQIARRFSITRETVYAVLRRAGVQTHADAEAEAEAAEIVLVNRQNAFAEAMREMLRAQGALEARLGAIERRLERLEQSGEHTTKGT